MGGVASNIGLDQMMGYAQVIKVNPAWEWSLTHYPSFQGYDD